MADTTQSEQVAVAPPQKSELEDFSAFDKILAEQKEANAGAPVPTSEELDQLIQTEAHPLEGKLAVNTQNIQVTLTVESKQSGDVEKLLKGATDTDIRPWPMDKASHAIVKFNCSEKQMANLVSELAKLDPAPKVSDASNSTFKSTFNIEVQKVKAESKENQATANQNSQDDSQATTPGKK